MTHGLPLLGVLLLLSGANVFAALRPVLEKNWQAASRAKAPANR